VKRAFNHVFVITKFSLWSVIGAHTLEPKREKVADSRRLLKGLRASSANEFTRVDIAGTSPYENSLEKVNIRAQIQHSRLVGA
jgi:hypothetical protein